MNKCYVFHGPSGSGKTTLAHAIFLHTKDHYGIRPAPTEKNEKNHLDYHFVSQETFEENDRPSGICRMGSVRRSLLWLK